jgi:hypothetical protein
VAVSIPLGLIRVAAPSPRFSILLMVIYPVPESADAHHALARVGDVAATLVIFSASACR